MKRNLFFLQTLFAFFALCTSVHAQTTWALKGNNMASVTNPRFGSRDLFPFKIITNNAERMMFLPNGYIGLGTSTPKTIFHVKGDQTISGNLNFDSAVGSITFPSVTAPASPMMYLFNAGTTNADRMVLGHSPNYPNWGLQYQDGSDKFNFLSGGTPVLSVDLGSRNVGIGNSNPQTNLDITGGDNWNLSASEGDVRIGSSVHRLKMGVALTGGGAGDAYVTGSGRLYLGAGSTLARTQTVSVNSNGRVGIGTFSPGSKLHVIGDTGTTATVFQAINGYSGTAHVRALYGYSVPADGWGYGAYATGGYRGGYFTADGGSSTGSAAGVQGFASGSGGVRYGVFGSASGGTENWGGYFSTKTYTNELRVGGTKGATGYVAAINGKLIATEVRVEAIGSWPDYVFSSNYNLLPLDELEIKLRSTHHLPGVPAAHEVKQNGIMLGEMQTKTIEKVEENTLYILQLNNRIKELEQKLEAVMKVLK